MAIFIRAFSHSLVKDTLTKPIKNEKKTTPTNTSIIAIICAHEMGNLKLLYTLKDNQRPKK